MLIIMHYFFKFIALGAMIVLAGFLASPERGNYWDYLAGFLLISIFMNQKW